MPQRTAIKLRSSDDHSKQVNKISPAGTTGTYNFIASDVASNLPKGNTVLLNNNR